MKKPYGSTSIPGASYVLTIPETRGEDGGVYQCSAQTFIGSTTVRDIKNVTVKVVGMGDNYVHCGDAEQH